MPRMPIVVRMTTKGLTPPDSAARMAPIAAAEKIGPTASDCATQSMVVSLPWARWAAALSTGSMVPPFWCGGWRPTSEQAAVLPDLPIRDGGVEPGHIGPLDA